MSDPRIDAAAQLMMTFAERTGLLDPSDATTSTTTAARPKRYLWTDAFAVCNFVGLARVAFHKDDRYYVGLASKLVDQVHHVLGQYRSDDRRRSGWISGLPSDQAEAHPTRGGLRIGKPLPERDVEESFDANLEWDRDGQYFHYLTKWMYALDQMTRATRDPKFNIWARELCVAAHQGFIFGAEKGAPKRMVWKASIDLSRPLVSSMGHHDPLEGFLTCIDLEATANDLGIPRGPHLSDQSADFSSLLVREGFETSDPLGLGGLLASACHLAQLEWADEDLVASILSSAQLGLQRYVMKSDLARPSDDRIAFRELGLAIGLRSMPILLRLARNWNPSTRASLTEVTRFVPLADAIERFWLTPEHRQSTAWRDHQDINDVMLATCLVPEGYLRIRSSAITAALSQNEREEISHAS